MFGLRHIGWFRLCVRLPSFRLAQPANVVVAPTCSEQDSASACYKMMNIAGTSLPSYSVRFLHSPNHIEDNGRNIEACDSSIPQSQVTEEAEEKETEGQLDYLKLGREGHVKEMPLSEWDLHTKLMSDPDQPEDAKVLQVAVVGAPNAGKSTLTNMLLGWRISSTSSKVHTTRSRVNAVLTEAEKQIIFLDTPGIVTPKKVKQHHLERSLLSDPHSSLFDADVIAVVVDVSTPWGRQELDKEILKALMLHHDKKSVLILNKIDALPSKQSLLTTTRILTEGIVGGQKHSKVKRESVAKSSATIMLDKILKTEIKSSEDDHKVPSITLEQPSEEKQKFHNYYSQLRRLNRTVQGRRGYDQFAEVFMVSAKEGDGVAELREFFLSQAQPGDWLYHSQVLTDQDPHAIAQQCVWEKLMDHLPQEVPYNIGVELVMWKEDEYGVLRIAMDLHCASQRHLKLLLGPRGQRIKLIAEQAKQELMNAFRRDLTLMLLAQFKKKEK